MSRIRPKTLEEVPELKPIFEAGHEMMGFYPNDGLIMAHHPELLKTFFGMVQAIYKKSAIEDGLKRMIGLICSQISGCEYCQAHTAMGARSKGIQKQKIEALWNFNESHLFSEAEKAALTVACHASMIPNASTEDEMAELKIHYSDQQIVEIVGVISLFGFLNKWNSTFKTEIEAQPHAFFSSLQQNHL